MININIPGYIKNVLKTFEDNNYNAYIVGGAIRDAVLKRNNHDYDITTNASIEEIKELFKDYRIIPTGLKHGTIVLLVNNDNVEITTFRGETNDLYSDVIKRDLTINSLVYSLKDGLIDKVDGVCDIKNKIIRFNENSYQRIIEDPLRILRAIRFSSVLNFKIDELSEKYLYDYKDLLKNISKERIREEFNKILLSNNPSLYLRKYFDIINVFIPELSKIKEFDQKNPYHNKDVLEHSFAVLDSTSPILPLRLAALFHDLGKADTFSVDQEGIGHFFNHPNISEQLTKSILKRLKYDNKTIDEVCLLIHHHDYNLDSKKSIKRMISIFNENINLFYELVEADRLAHTNQSYCKLSIKEIKEITEDILKNNLCFTLKDLNINGNDLMQLGFSQGKEIGCVLDTLLKLVINEELENKRELLITKAKELLKSEVN